MQFKAASKFCGKRMKPRSINLSGDNKDKSSAVGSMRTVTYAAEQVAEDVRRYIAGEPQNNRCT